MKSTLLIIKKLNELFLINHKYENMKREFLISILYNSQWSITYINISQNNEYSYNLRTNEKDETKNSTIKRNKQHI